MTLGHAPLAAIGRRLIGSRQTAESRRENRAANFAAIVLNGLFFPTAGKILGAGLLLTWFVSDLTHSAFVVGLLVPIQYGIALLAQPWIAQWMSGQPRRVPFYRDQALVRGALWSALAAAVWSFGEERRRLLLAIFFVVVAADALAAGVGNIAFNDVLARVMPKPLRGRARGGRGMAGAIVGGIAGASIAMLVAPESSFAVFAALFIIAGMCYALGGLTFGLIAEPEMHAARRMRTDETLSSRVRTMFKRPGFGRFLAIQALLLPATQGLVFFSLFGRREFQLDLKVLGLLLISDAVGPFVGDFFWGRWADRFGNRWVLAAAALLGFIAPAMALTLTFAGTTLPRVIIVAAFGFIVFVLGATSAGIDLASKNLILDLAPDEARRPVYIGMNDTLVALPTILLAGAGAAIDWFGYRPVFIAVAAAAACAALLSLTWPSRRLATSPLVEQGK
jgi:MFS family permease